MVKGRDRLASGPSPIRLQHVAIIRHNPIICDLPPSFAAQSTFRAVRRRLADWHCRCRRVCRHCAPMPGLSAPLALGTPRQIRAAKAALPITAGLRPIHAPAVPRAAACTSQSRTPCDLVEPNGAVDVRPGEYAHSCWDGVDAISGCTGRTCPWSELAVCATLHDPTQLV